jgi:hypothetical protein
LFGDDLSRSLEQKGIRVALRKCSGVVRSTKVFVGRCKGWHLKIILLGNKIFLVEEKKKNVFSAQNWFEY